MVVVVAVRVVVGNMEAEVDVESFEWVRGVDGVVLASVMPEAFIVVPVCVVEVVLRWYLRRLRCGGSVACEVATVGLDEGKLRWCGV